MADQRAFVLKEAYRDSFAGGSIAIAPDGHTLNIGERLEEGRGVVTAKNDQEANALVEYEHLKEVSAQEAKDIRREAKVSKGSDR